MLQIVRVKKVDEKNGVICQVSMFSLSFKLSKEYSLCNFMLISAKNRILLKQFTHMHLKGFITHFQKMVLFIILCYCLLSYCFRDIRV